MVKNIGESALYPCQICCLYIKALQLKTKLEIRFTFYCPTYIETVLNRKTLRYYTILAQSTPTL